MSGITERTPETLGPPGGQPGVGGAGGLLRQSAALLARQREATVFVVAVALLLYFGVKYNSTFVSQTNFVNLLSETAAPIMIIAIGEVFLLICGEIDLSVGFVYTFAPFLMHYLIDFYHVPALLAIIISLVFGLVVGWFNGFLTVTMGLPSFITTLGTGFILLGLTLTTSHAYPATIPASSVSYGRWIGASSWSQIIWAVGLTAVAYVVLTRTKWGLYTIATGGNQLGAREAGIKVSRVKYGNFMMTSVLGALVGLQVAFYTNTIDPTAGGYQPMFYAVTAAVIGGTAMLGGQGTVLGAFLGALVLATLINGLNVAGISANPLDIVFGAAILLSMIINVRLARLRAAGRN
ncbi:MAG TPA: ABC transporter permease [Streptosporangiaceae bacterium]|nr:ABC transporter permease [Streptosporangiaceae bacterium]